MSMITGSWKETTLLCDHCSSPSFQATMPLKQTNKGITFECPSDGCHNMITQYEFEKMLDHLAKTIMQAEMNGECFVLTGYRWRYRMHEYIVKKQTETEMIVAVRNLQRKDN